MDSIAALFSIFPFSYFRHLYIRLKNAQIKMNVLFSSIQIYNICYTELTYKTTLLLFWLFFVSEKHVCFKMVLLLRSFLVYLVHWATGNKQSATRRHDASICISAYCVFVPIISNVWYVKSIFESTEIWIGYENVHSTHIECVTQTVTTLNSTNKCFLNRSLRKIYLKNKTQVNEIYLLKSKCINWSNNNTIWTQIIMESSFECIGNWTIK